MTSSILPLAKGSRARREWPTGSAQCAALVGVLLINALVADNFFAIHIQDGRLFGSLIDILNRCAPVALLSLGMTLVIATGGLAIPKIGATDLGYKIARSFGLEVTELAPALDEIGCVQLPGNGAASASAPRTMCWSPLTARSC